jgi:Uncharacterized protein conserved in bacteria (DUF2147)
MKRFCALAVLMVLSSSAYAGTSFSFVIGGHRIRIEAPRHCSSSSCVSVSIPGRYQTRRGRDRYDDDAAVPAKPPAPAPQPVALPLIVPPASKPPIQPVASALPPPAIVRPAASAPQEATAPPQPAIQPPATPAVTPPIETPADPARPAPGAAPRVLKVSHEVDDEPAAAPLGDWRTEADKGSVRIEKCGGALCGYVLNPSSNAVGETVLINMKPKAAAEWSGTIYSRASGNTYYATIALKGPNSLRVEACALGKFFCSGNIWRRIGAPPEKLMTSRQPSPAPRS